MKLLAMDLDGTTVNRQGHLGEKTKAALTRARSRGIGWYLPPDGGTSICSPSGLRAGTRIICC